MKIRILYNLVFIIFLNIVHSMVTYVDDKLIIGDFVGKYILVAFIMSTIIMNISYFITIIVNLYIKKNVLIFFILTFLVNYIIEFNIRIVFYQMISYTITFFIMKYFYKSEVSG